MSRGDAAIEGGHRVGVCLQQGVLPVGSTLSHHEALHDVGLAHSQLPFLQLEAEGDGVILGEEGGPEAVGGAE